VRLAVALLLGLAPAVLAGPVVVVSYDGFRWDYVYRPAARWFRAFARGGVRARTLEPVFPTKTYPNHYSMVTGRYPAGHGIVANRMWDPERRARFAIADREAVEDGAWWGAEPLWNTAAREGLRTFVYFWPGAEAAVGGLRPERWFAYDRATTFEAQVDTALRWLELPEEERPDLVLVYFREPDGTGHRAGPDSPEVDATLARLGAVSERLVEGIRERTPEAEVLLVSDHGMAPVDPERVAYLDDYLDLDGFRLVDDAPVASLWPPPGARAATLAALEEAPPAIDCRAREELPEVWRYRGHPRIAPVVCVAEEGWQIARERAAGPPAARGMHGYPPEVEAMGGLFLARGPSFRVGRVIGGLRNLEVYGLVCHLLGIPAAPHDGDPEAWAPLLRAPAP